jgi:hypothetical protein
LATTAGSGASPFILIISERISLTVSAKVKNYFYVSSNHARLAVQRPAG